MTRHRSERKNKARDSPSGQLFAAAGGKHWGMMTDGVNRPEWLWRDVLAAAASPGVWRSMRRGARPLPQLIDCCPSRSEVARAVFLDAPEYQRDFITYAMIVVICTPLPCSLVGSRLLGDRPVIRAAPNWFPMTSELLVLLSMSSSRCCYDYNPLQAYLSCLHFLVW